MQLDFNLLEALDALLEEGSVAGAADRLRLSSPAMSRTLGRIRRVTGDQILVRTGQTMSPTAYAQGVRAEVHDLVRRVRAVFDSQRELNLATLERTFTMRFHDAITASLGPCLLAEVQDQAPGVMLRLMAEGSTDTNDLRQGLIDLEINSHMPKDADIRSEPLGQDRFVLAVRPDHPLLSGDLTLERYTQARHLTVSRRGRLLDPIDAALQAEGLRRRVVAAAPTVIIALHFARRSDLVVAVAGTVCAPMIQALDLRVLPIPLDLPSLPLILSWHQRDENDRAHIWIRNSLKGIFKSIIR